VSPRGFAILFVVTVIAVLGAIAVTVLPTLRATESVTGEPMFPQLSQHLADAGKVTVSTPQYTIAWELRNGVWVSPERGDYPARKGVVSDLVVSLSRMTKVEAKTSKPDWYQYIRVGDPAATPPTGVAHVTVASADGDALAETILGARSHAIAAAHARGGTFVRVPDEAQSWLVEGSATVLTELPEWFDTIVDIPGTEVSGLAILTGDKTVFEAKKTEESIYELTYLDPAEAAAGSVANANSIRSTASAIVGLRVGDVRAVGDISPGDDARTDRFTTTSGLRLDMTVFNADGGIWAVLKAWASEGGEAAEMAAAINSRTANWAFRLNESVATRLTQPIINLVQKPADPATSGADPVPLDGRETTIVPPGSESGDGMPSGRVLPTF
jgi:hypothetical protein